MLARVGFRVFELVYVSKCMPASVLRGRRCESHHSHGAVDGAFLKCKNEHPTAMSPRHGASQTTIPNLEDLVSKC